MVVVVLVVVRVLEVDLLFLDDVMFDGGNFLEFLFKCV